MLKADALLSLRSENRLFLTMLIGASGALLWHITHLSREPIAEFLNCHLSETTLIGTLMGALVLGWFSHKWTARMHSASVAELRGELSEFRKVGNNAMATVRTAIRQQFAQWKFTKTESAVAEFLVRGYSLRQIAAMQQKSEGTVRNQSITIYRKAGMTGRRDLVAFFLNDLFEED